MKFYISKTESEHLFKAWFFISLAFAIAMTRPLSALLTSKFLFNFTLAAITVGVGFVFHEMAHKLVAQKYHCFAEFRASNPMLIFAVLISFTGVIFAAPGAVMINGNINKKKHGQIAAAGPAMNLIIAVIFLALMLTITNPLARAIFYYGLLINSWLAMFNLLPFPMFDGIKIMQWDKAVYAILIILAATMMLLQGLTGQTILAGTKFF